MPLEKQEYVSNVWREGIFKDKVVFCTGGAGTICSAQVRALVHLGADACIVGRNVEKTERMAKDLATARSGARVLGLGSVDVRKMEDLQAAADRCARELGGIDFCIAGAAGNFLSTLDGLSSNAFKAVIDIDVLGSFNTVKATVPYLLESAKRHRNDGRNSSTGGRIIFVSATFHYRGSAPLQSHVSAAKAAVDSLAHSVAVEHGPRGITSNVIAPGPIANTEGMERLSRPEDIASTSRRIPLGRMGMVKEIADATVYLFSDAGNYVNSNVLVVDGGHWRSSSFGASESFPYPDFLLGDTQVTGVKGMKKQKGGTKL